MYCTVWSHYSILRCLLSCFLHRNPRPLSRPNFKEILNVLLKDETQTLQIPVKDACTHEAAILLGSELEAGNYMYTDLQHTYATSASSTPIPTSGKDHRKRSDYDHISISGQNFLFTFPTSSADLESVFNGQCATDSVVPQPSLISSKSEAPPARSEEGQQVSTVFRKEPLHSLDSDYEEMVWSYIYHVNKFWSFSICTQSCKKNFFSCIQIIM